MTAAVAGAVENAPRLLVDVEARHLRAVHGTRDERQTSGWGRRCRVGLAAAAHHEGVSGGADGENQRQL